MQSAITIIEPVKVYQVEEETLSMVLGQLITKTAMVAGFTLQNNAISIMLPELLNDLQTRFKLLELPEIKKAFENGVRNQYGDYYGINVVTINKWLKGYIEAGEHNNYLLSKIDRNQKQLTEKAPMTQCEIDEIMRAGIVRCFEEYKKTGRAVDHGSPKINWLLNNAFAVPSQEERQEFKELAREQLESEARDKKESIYRNDRNEAKKEMESLIIMLETDPKIQTRAKNLYLMAWFEEIIESGQDINEIIK